mgnify:CR=1 FL=1
MKAFLLEKAELFLAIPHLFNKSPSLSKHPATFKLLKKSLRKYIAFCAGIVASQGRQVCYRY